MPDVSSRASVNSEVPVSPVDHVARPRYIMVGGFLGAGKTTAILQLAGWLHRQGRRVGLISNDQGSKLVDTALFAAREFAVEEIAGGCFCCRFNSLVEAAQRLSATTRPEVFLAEPVGSCTDLIATVAYPLRQIYGEHFTIAPLSVLVDPIRAARVLGLESGARFSDKVAYIYRKQLEEADLLVINKCDLLDDSRRERLRAALASAFPLAQIFEISARRGDGLQAWCEYLSSTEQKPRAAMAMDYELYAEGEARLGWLNGTLQLQSVRPLDANTWLEQLARAIQQRLRAANAEVAHLKMTLDPHGAFPDLAAINLVGNDFVPELAQLLPDQVTAGEITINLRAEAEPEILRAAVTASVQHAASLETELQLAWQTLEAFKPGKPQPTHRLG